LKLTVINGIDLVRSLKAGCINLEHRCEEVNRLNVFPVPDGDTGTNMYLTLMSAVKEGEKHREQKIGPVMKAISNGSLMGARGNSGVILSQIFRGLARVLENKEEATAADLAEALVSGAGTAYKAVMKPVEGTILTVVKEISAACQEAAERDDDLIAVLLYGIERGHIMLQKTPSMLPILKEAGVVDSGGQGLIFFLQGFVEGLAGAKEIELADYQPSAPEALAELIRDDITLEFQYCTETLIKGADMECDDIKDHLSPLGDSMLVVGGGDIVKVHIHSNHPGKVLESCLQFGALSDIKINNMLEEVHEHKLVQEADAIAAAGPVEGIGLVAVAAGEGIEEILKSMGVAQVVKGGQTMNPSTEDILKACSQLPQRKVIILPNNPNIILAANQAVDLSDKEVRVLPTKSIMQAITALVVFDPTADLDEILNAMQEAYRSLHYAEFTTAVKDSSVGGREIKTGDLIGLVDGEIVGSGQDIITLMDQVIIQMQSPDTEIMTLLYGQEVQETERFRIEEHLRERYTDLEIELHYGGQQHYDYLLALE
jgi:DAK2 domain fusion protein YloV